MIFWHTLPNLEHVTICVQSPFGKQVTFSFPFSENPSLHWTATVELIEKSCVFTKPSDGVGSVHSVKSESVDLSDSNHHPKNQIIQLLYSCRADLFVNMKYN